MNNNSKEPLFHIIKRGALPWYKAWGIRLLAVVIALIVCAIVTMTVTGENPIQVYATMIDSSFGSERKVWILAQNTGKPIEQINIDTERDNYMTAQEALEYGLIDKVITNR